VVSGLLRQYLPSRDGRQITIRFTEAGDLVGNLIRMELRAEAAGWGIRPWLAAEVEAVEPSVLLHLDLPRLERTARLQPALAMAFAEELADMLRNSYRTLAATAFATVRSRLARDLLERAGRAEAPRPGARVRVTQQALADATGSVREVVARALRELRRRGVIETHQSGVTILDVRALIAEAG
jgi:CRP/FNR family transcriptional regulator